VVRRTSKIKPVLIWKVAMTNTGRKAASSHTGSMAGDEAVWNCFFTQSGAVRIDNIDDLIDSTIARQQIPIEGGFCDIEFPICTEVVNKYPLWDKWCDQYNVTSILVEVKNMKKESCLRRRKSTGGIS
jgi:hypothetical protein